MTLSFAPSLGSLTAAIARRPLLELWRDPDELARSVLMTAATVGATHVLFPFDLAVLAEACGCPVAWEDEPRIDGPLPISPSDLEPEEVLRSGRVPATISVVRAVTKTVPLAARIPSGPTLLEQVGGDPSDTDQASAVDDVVAGFARALLEAGCAELVVEEVPVSSNVAPSIERLAEHFGVTVRALGVGRTGSVVSVSSLLDTPEHSVDPSAFCADQLVLTDGPVPPDADLARLARLSAAIRAIEAEPC